MLECDGRLPKKDVEIKNANQNFAVRMPPLTGQNSTFRSKSSWYTLRRLNINISPGSVRLLWVFTSCKVRMHSETTLIEGTHLMASNMPKVLHHLHLLVVKGSNPLPRDP